MNEDFGQMDAWHDDEAAAAEEWDRDRLKTRVAELEAERDRLREALERIAAQHGWCTEVQTHVLARRALEGTSDRL